MSATGHVVFSHGRDGTPFGTKIRALYEIAEAEGYEVAAVDYRGVDDIGERVQMLHEFCRGFSGHLLLVGAGLDFIVRSYPAQLPVWMPWEFNWPE